MLFPKYNFNDPIGIGLKHTHSQRNVVAAAAAGGLGGAGFLQGLGAVLGGIGALQGGGDSRKLRGTLGREQKPIFQNLTDVARRGTSGPQINPFGHGTGPTDTQKALTQRVGPLSDKVGQRTPVAGADQAKAKAAQRLGSPKEQANELMFNNLMATQKKLFGIINNTGAGQ